MAEQVAVRLAHPLFTDREVLFIHHLADGMTYAEMAKAEGMKLEAVKSIMYRIFSKVCARNGANMVHIAHQMGVLG